MYVCFGLIHLPHTESMRSQTLRQLSQHGVRLHVNWVNAEDANIYEDFIIPRWLSWCVVSLCVDSVDVESHLALTQLTRSETPRQLSHRRMFKNLNKSANSRTKSKNAEALLFGLYSMCLINAKKEKKISCKCTFNQTRAKGSPLERIPHH
jgi:hypothetical protein